MKLKYLAISGLLIGLILPTFLGCSDDDTVGVSESNLLLVFEDNFDGPEGAAINMDVWNFDIGTGQDGWGNQELQYYTDRPENIALDGQGNLVISAKRESFQGSEFTSAYEG